MNVTFQCGKVYIFFVFVVPKEMERQVNIGMVRSIGLSSFSASHIEQIYDSSEIKPMVVQVELHAYLQQELREKCKELNIAVTAYLPLGSPGIHFSKKYNNYSVTDVPRPDKSPTGQVHLQQVPEAPGQVLLRYLIQHGIIIIPKSSNPKRIKSNIDIFDFELSNEDMVALDGLDKNEQRRVFDFLFNPFKAGGKWFLCYVYRE